MKLSRLFTPSERDKRYFVALVVFTGVILYWRGVWDVTYELPLLSNNYVCIFLGLVVITLTGVVFAEFDPLAARMEQTLDVLHTLVRHKENKNKGYTIKYYDQLAKKHVELPHHKIDKIEREFVVIKEGKKEIFIPVHRIEEIKEKGKSIWKKGRSSED